jgi:UDP-N-acetylmuramate: L-alanyl-gamma-D-glutamyl-meso-diaminopimelate ligase
MNLENNQNHKKEFLDPALNIIPDHVKRIHLMGICGTAMASLAGMLKQKSYMVTGSDQNIYPPMSDFLEDLDIQVQKGYRPENLSPSPDLVIVGNVISRQNPEVVQLGILNIPYISMPQALGEFAFKDKISIVVSGTHGKTTTSSLASHVLEEAGLDPGFMIGGIVKNFLSSFKLGKGPYFVIEGDEYDTAFFDKGPKFLHYKPGIVILTSIEFDHADIFRDLNHVVETFRRLIEIIPQEGLLIANRDDQLVMEEAKRARCSVITYGLKEGAAWRATNISIGDDATSFDVMRKGQTYASLATPLYGDYNVSNLLSIVALAENLNIEWATLYNACRDFKGVKRRQEIRGEKGGILVLDDFAHHPTAVEKTIEAVKARYTGRRLLAVFEPRSNSSRRKVFQEKYGLAFDKADLVFIPDPVLMEKIPVEERFSSVELVESINARDIKAQHYPDSQQLLEALAGEARKGDVILIMSNGSFDNLHERLLEKL